MYSAREDIYNAVAALASTMPGVGIVTRRLLSFDQIKAFTEPAVIVEEETEDPTVSEGNIAYMWSLRVNLILFNNIGPNPNLNVTPMTAINQMLDSLEQAFQPDTPGGVLSLGGLVMECKFNGRIEKRQNGTDGWASAFVPLRLESVST